MLSGRKPFAHSTFQWRYREGGGCERVLPLSLAPFPCIGMSEDSTFGERLQAKSGAKYVKKYKSTYNTQSSSKSAGDLPCKYLFDVFK